MARAGFYDSLINSEGQYINGATVTVYVIDTGTPATIYRPDGVTSIPGGTFLTGYLDSLGEITFTADNGQYDIKIVNGAETRWIENVTILDGSSTISDTDLATTTTPGIVEKATSAEMTAGTADKFPDASDVKTYVDDSINALTFLQDQRVVIDFASDANYTLSAGENNYSQIEMTDTGVVLTTTREVIIDTTPKVISFINSTAQTLNVKTASGTAYSVTADGYAYWLYSDGADVVAISQYVDPTTSRIFNQTPIATTSGTSITLSSSIPSGVKRIRVNFSGTSLDATAVLIIRLGTGGSPTTSGYTGYTTLSTTSSGGLNHSSGYDVSISSAASNVYYGNVVFELANPSSNTWSASASIASTAGAAFLSGGEVSLSGALDTVVITTIAGTANFDAGSAALSWEY